jgi:hypothetical protein
MSNFNRAIVQIPAFILIAGVIVAMNWLTRPETTPVKNPRQLPPKIVIEHAQEEIGRIRAELESIKENAEYAKSIPEPQTAAPHSTDATEPTPM